MDREPVASAAASGCDGGCDISQTTNYYLASPENTTTACNTPGCEGSGASGRKSRGDTPNVPTFGPEREQSWCSVTIQWHGQKPK